MTSASSPAACFFDRIEPTINDSDSTVPVASRIAYNRRSAGARLAVWPTIAHPTRATAARRRSGSRNTSYPGIDSSLSSVPPVWPSPRPEIIGTKPPHAARIGASSRLTLSPTPPVECLSSTGPARPASDQSRMSPDRVMAPVSAIRSAAVIPRQTIAIASAPTWASVTVPSAIPRTSCEISSADSS